MNQKAKKHGIRPILWWIIWITSTIVTFFIAAYIWSPIIHEHFGSVREPKAAAMWVTAVFGTWMVFLVPLIIFMYAKVDKAYEDARIRREIAENAFKSIEVPKEKRLLPDSVASKLTDVAETIDGGHLVDLTLKSGQQVPLVFVAGGKEILGIYDVQEMAFEANDVVDLKPVDMNQPPHFFQQSWLRLDGTQPQG